VVQFYQLENKYYAKLSINPVDSMSPTNSLAEEDGNVNRTAGIHWVR